MSTLSLTEFGSRHFINYFVVIDYAFVIDHFIVDYFVANRCLARGASPNTLSAIVDYRVIDLITNSIVDMCSS